MHPTITKNVKATKVNNTAGTEGDVEPLTREQWESINSEVWREMLSGMWTRSMIALSPAIYWVALRGALHEPDDDKLEQAATDLMAAVKDGHLTVYGYRRDGGSSSPYLAPVPVEAFFPFARFIPEIDDIAALNNGEPGLLLNFVLEPDGRDRIAKYFDEILVDSLSVRREDLLRKWPAGRAPLREICRRIVDSAGVVDQKAAWKLAQVAGANYSRSEFLDEWKAVIGPQKRGPKGPRN